MCVGITPIFPVGAEEPPAFWTSPLRDSHAGAPRELRSPWLEEEASDITQRPKAFLASFFAFTSFFLLIFLSFLSVSVALPWGWKKWIWNCFPHVNSRGGSRALGRSINITEQHLLNEKACDNQRIPFLEKVKICSSRKASKVNYLMKLLKLLESQSSVEGEHLRERKDK